MRAHGASAPDPPHDDDTWAGSYTDVSTSQDEFGDWVETRTLTWDLTAVG